MLKCISTKLQNNTRFWFIGGKLQPITFRHLSGIESNTSHLPQGFHLLLQHVRRLHEIQQQLAPKNQK
jgi:hypothetical protein